MEKNRELQLLEQSIEMIIKIAQDFGLDFYPMRFEICPADIIYTFGAYGMPTRYTHWSFGKAYYRNKTQYDYNLSRIYELVINSNPCYAFLLDGNTVIQNKMVVAHVLGHSDFFKNNAWFRHTNRNMLESMSAAAQRFRAYELKYGRVEVEQFLDAVMALQQHIDPSPHIKPTINPQCQCQSPTSEYDDLWELEKVNEKQTDGCCSCRPVAQQEDLMLFLLKHAKDLKDWQKDIISVLREEMLYFWPQMQTKIMNEGWASYWHLRIMREMDLDESEALDFAKMHAEVIQPTPTGLNPYLLGLKIFEDIEKRWHRDQIFEVRCIDNDVSFLRNYLTKELVEELDLYLYRKVGQDYKIVTKDWQLVRDQLVQSLNNCGVPVITVEDGDYKKRGELYLKHRFDGLELDVFQLEKTLPYVFQIWGRQVHLETVIDKKTVVFSYNGKNLAKKFM